MVARTPPADRRRAHAVVTDHALRAVIDRAPEGVTVERLEDSPDLSRADFLVPPPGDRSILEVLPELERLSVIQVLSAGTDWIEDHVPPGVILCSARGARDAPVAEWVLAALLGASSTLLECARERTWGSRHLTDLERWTVLVVGMGSIGRLVEKRLHAFGTQVLGVASRAREDVHGVEELPELLPRADAVVLLTPLDRGHPRSDRRSHARPDARRRRARQRRARSGRGHRRARGRDQSGRLSAVLDVTDPEPLPNDHPLWSAPRGPGHQPAHGRGFTGGPRPGGRVGRRAAGPLVRR